MLLAVALGGLVGWERTRHDQPAGLRTHILVCVGAALITLVDRGTPGVGGRIAAQIVTGVGFLGAGTILRASDGFAVRGLTTAASVWAVAAVGIAVGFGGVYAPLAVVATLIILFTLTTVNRLEDVLARRRQRQRLSVVFAPGGEPMANVQRTLRALKGAGCKVRDLQMEKMNDSDVVRLWLRLPHDLKRDSLDDLLSGNTSIIHYDWDE